MSRLRLQQFLLQPVVVVDDGETLAPGPPIQPVSLTLEQLRELLDAWPEQLAAIQTTYDQQNPPAPPPNRATRRAARKPAGRGALREKL